MSKKDIKQTKQQKERTRPVKPKCRQYVSRQQLRRSAGRSVESRGIEAARVYSASVMVLKRNCCVNEANIYLRIETDGGVECGLKLQSNQTLRTHNDSNAPKAPLPVIRARATYKINTAKRGTQIKT